MCAYVCMCLVTQLYTTLSTLWTVAHQTRLSMGILQARILEGVAFPFSRGSSQPRDRTQVSALRADSLPLSHQVSPFNNSQGSCEEGRLPLSWHEDLV